MKKALLFALLRVAAEMFVLQHKKFASQSFQILIFKFTVLAIPILRNIVRMLYTINISFLKRFRAKPSYFRDCAKADLLLNSYCTIVNLHHKKTNDRVVTEHVIFNPLFFAAFINLADFAVLIPVKCNAESVYAASLYLLQLLILLQWQAYQANQAA